MTAIAAALGLAVKQHGNVTPCIINASSNMRSRTKVCSVFVCTAPLSVGNMLYSLFISGQVSDRGNHTKASAGTTPLLSAHCAMHPSNVR